LPSDIPMRVQVVVYVFLLEHRGTDVHKHCHCS